MSVIRHLGGLVHRGMVSLTASHLTPGTGLPFEWFLQSQAVLAKSDWYRRAAFGDDLAPLNRFLETRGIVDPEVVETAHRQRTMASLIRRVRRYYNMFPAEKMRRWLPLDPSVATALQERPALLLASHFGAGLLTLPALAQAGVPVLAVVRTGPKATFKPANIDVCNLRLEATDEAAARAWRTLRQGGVVFIAGDGRSRHASAEIEVSLLGRPRRINRGFAQLAISAGVAPRMIYSRVECSGEIVTCVEPPLSITGCTPADRVRNLATDYADRLTQLAMQYPGNISPGMLRFALGETPTH